MRKSNLFAVALAMLVSGHALAGGVDPCAGDLKFLESVPTEVSTQIRVLLKERNGFNLGEKDEMHAVVRFTLNSEREIVVLSVNTEDERLESFVKARLNYEKVADQNLVEGKIYAVPIRLQA